VKVPIEKDEENKKNYFLKYFDLSIFLLIRDVDLWEKHCYIFNNCLNFLNITNKLIKHRYNHKTYIKFSK